MPRFCKPDVIYKIVLEEDEGSSPLPAFFAKSVSMATHWKVAEAIDREGIDTVDEYFNKNVDALMEVLTGWENIVDPNTNEEIKFSREAILKVLTAKEVMEVVRKALYNDTIKVDEKKS